MPRRPMLRATIARLAAATLIVAALIAACGSPAPSPTPEPTERPTPQPLASPTPAGGPLNGEGALGRGTYETPDGFTPAFAFDIRSDAWRSITPPDDFGFVLVTPNALNAEAFIGLVKPTATSIEQFTGEMGNTGFLDGTETLADLEIDGMAARSFSISRTTSSEAFTIHTPDGIIQTSFGGELSDNRFVYVAHPDGPFCLLLSMTPDGAVETRFVFETLVDSIAFR